MKTKIAAFLVCLVLLLIPHPTYAQVPGGENSRECANYDHCADRIGSNYRAGKRGCTVAEILGSGACLVVSATGAGLVLSAACVAGLIYASDRCRSEQARICRSNLRGCDRWNTTGRCFSHACSG